MEHNAQPLHNTHYNTNNYKSVSLQSRRMGHHAPSKTINNIYDMKYIPRAQKKKDKLLVTTEKEKCSSWRACNHKCRCFWTPSLPAEIFECEALCLPTFQPSVRYQQTQLRKLIKTKKKKIKRKIKIPEKTT